MNRKFINNKADYTLICIYLFFYFSISIIYVFMGFYLVERFFLNIKGTEGRVMLDYKEGRVRIKCFRF